MFSLSSSFKFGDNLDINTVIIRSFLTYETEFRSIFSGAGKFCFSNGQRQLTCDVKSDIKVLNFRRTSLMRYQSKHRITLVEVVMCDVKCHKRHDE